SNTRLLTIPSSAIDTSWRPGGKSCGNWKLIWYSPAKPGASPEKLACKALPPTNTVGCASVCDRKKAEAASPVSGGELTAPRPTAYNSTGSPGRAGRCVALNPSVGKLIAPMPVEGAKNKPGRIATGTATATLAPDGETTSIIALFDAMPNGIWKLI